MPKPQSSDKAGDMPVSTKTMFYTEGNPAALLVVNNAGRRSERMMGFPVAEAALTWCRQNGAMLVYMPVNIVNS
jgi:hypothetical protein